MISLNELPLKIGLEHNEFRTSARTCAVARCSIIGNVSEPYMPDSRVPKQEIEIGAIEEDDLLC